MGKTRWDRSTKVWKSCWACPHPLTDHKWIRWQYRSLPVCQRGSCGCAQLRGIYPLNDVRPDASAIQGSTAGTSFQGDSSQRWNS